MKYWNDLPESVLFNRVFTRPISIEKIELFKIEIDNDRPHIFIEFDLVGELPDSPPEKWKRGKFNRCRAGLLCYDVEKFSASNIPNRSLFDIKINEDQKGFQINLKNETSHVSLFSGSVSISGPSVYLAEENE